MSASGVGVSSALANSPPGSMGRADVAEASPSWDETAGPEGGARSTVKPGPMGAAEGQHGEGTAAPVPGSVGEAACLLADGAIAALPGWVERCVTSACESAGMAGSRLGAAAHAAGQQCVAEIGPELRALLAADVDAQQTTPLSILRAAVRFPTRVLADGGVPEPERDDFDASRFPDDPYGLTPASFADIDPALGPIGIAWGAAKAFEVLQRRRSQR